MMDTGHPERRTIQELLVRYEFEPEIRDIYVEGSDDKSILQGVLRESGVTDVFVFDISTVDVPLDGQEETSNRTRLVRLAGVLSEASDVRATKVLCVVDSDFEHVTLALPDYPKLLRTDYANMEMYLFTADTLERVNSRCLGRAALSQTIVKRFMVPTLMGLFVIRYVNSRGSWRLKYLSFEKQLAYEDGRFSFDRREYLRRYLNKSGRVRELDDFIREVESTRVDEKKDTRCFMHGHDFLVVTRYVLNSLRKKKIFRDEEIVLSLLRACADYKELAKESLFSRLLEHFALESRV